MIRLRKPFNWKGDLLPAGTEIGLGELEEKLIKSGAAEKVSSQEKKSSERPSKEDFEGLFAEYERSCGVVEELQKQITEKDKLIAELQSKAEVSEASQEEVPQTEEKEESPAEISEEKPVGRTKK